MQQGSAHLAWIPQAVEHTGWNPERYEQRMPQGQQPTETGILDRPWAMLAADLFGKDPPQPVGCHPGLGRFKPVARQCQAALRSGPPAVQIDEQLLVDLRYIRSLVVTGEVVFVPSDQFPWQVNAECLHKTTQQRGPTAVHACDQDQW